MGEEEATMRERLVEAMMRAMATSQGHSDEGNIGMLIDELDRTENNNRIIIRAAATTALDAALAMLETPSEEMWGGLARQLIMWMDMGNKTPAVLLKHLERSGRDIPDWLRDEPEMQALNHVPSKGTRAVLVFRAMLATLRSPKI